MMQSNAAGNEPQRATLGGQFRKLYAAVELGPKIAVLGVRLAATRKLRSSHEISARR
jgi:hypothetical protein